MIVLALD
jgi:Holliday junction resolvasome RuvABC endonuclease subunit